MINESIERTYDTYHWLLMDFLEAVEIKDRFIKALETFNGFNISIYINKVLLKKGSGITFAITSAFPFTYTGTANRKFWNEINEAWQHYLIECAANNVPKRLNIKAKLIEKSFKSIW